MKKLYLFFTTILFVTNVSAQITYKYDDAGNRVLRKIPESLPVTLISFTATKAPGHSEGAIALLNWQTASEINFDRFVIERSREGKKWIDIGSVTASGDKKTSCWYSFPDKNPLKGENLYRLRMIDKDGTFSFSRIQGVYFDAQVSFYPNPVKDLLNILGSADGYIQILNNAGKEVYSSDHFPPEGIDMNKFSTGIYLVRITHKDGSSTIRKVVKQ